MRIMVTLALALPMLAQTPTALDEHFFQGNPKFIQIACLEQAMAINSRDSDQLVEYGGAFLAVGERDRAQQCFKTAITLNPKEPETFRLIAAAWFKEGEKTEALKALAEMERVGPLAAGEFADAAINLLENGSPAEADELMQKAWKLKPNRDSWYREFALIAMRMSLRELADRWAERSIKADPKVLLKDWDKCLEFAKAAHFGRMPDVAAKWVVRAIAIRPKGERMWRDIAFLYAKPVPPSSLPD